MLTFFREKHKQIFFLLNVEEFAKSAEFKWYKVRDGNYQRGRGASICTEDILYHIQQKKNCKHLQISCNLKPVLQK